ncbi:DNA ligase D [Jeotgalibacillus haloalkalitolerans]|uniref:DNA ligase (ATP) n=1 Tax=Jeotgalibacillus haloalkalitolerans TaxID=3104292 RepID=A0ABU5KHS9_9BACL|nr:DNA ligase D [Jeotgalibacillus sp. HH7-29]MDZ5710781.1 DNA ligase D [Jeotgalibacillus sp. HH7-29]
MLLTATNAVPSGPDWLYEVKYDGFRCMILWEEQTPRLVSRNEKTLNHLFPEIVAFCEERYEAVKPYLPLLLDGELVYLLNSFRSHFTTVQTRGRMGIPSVIQKHRETFPCHYIAFDLLTYKGRTLQTQTLSKRKKQLTALFTALSLPLSVDAGADERIQGIDLFESRTEAIDWVELHHGEGVIAKKKTGQWQAGKRSEQWLKEKNWRFITVFLTFWDKNNGYFHGAIYHEDGPFEVVHFRHGLNGEQENALKELFQTSGEKMSASMWSLPPSVCVDIACIDFDGKHLREPRFHAFNFEAEPEECTWKTLHRQLFPLPERVAVTHPEKPVWPDSGLVKDDYLLYLQLAAPYLMPFLQDRLLTVIRYPHGAAGERFYQKNCPDYAPDFVLTKKEDGISYILCNSIDTLLWLGNQLSLEFHIPFQTIHTKKPTEIVFDLDPPSAEAFSLAIEAALRMKAIFDEFGLHSYIKVSGGKGLQVYIPLSGEMFTYEETRIFTSFICDFLCEQKPRWFTTERLKKNRHNKLYLDYIQHDAGKTIIAPYSARGSEQGLVAAPLFWNEVNEKLHPSQFPLPAVIDRLTKQGDPFKSFRQQLNDQPFSHLLEQLKELIGNRKSPVQKW